MLSLTYGRDGVDGVAQLQLVQHGRLAGSVQAQHQDSAFSRSCQRVEYSAHKHAHGWLVGSRKYWLKGAKRFSVGLLLGMAA